MRNRINNVTSHIFSLCLLIYLVSGCDFEYGISLANRTDEIFIVDILTDKKDVCRTGGVFRPNEILEASFLNQRFNIFTVEIFDRSRENIIATYKGDYKDISEYKILYFPPTSAMKQYVTMEPSYDEIVNLYYTKKDEE